MQVTIAAGVLFSYALQFYVAVTFVWPDFLKAHGPFKKPVLCELGVRAMLVLFTCKLLIMITYITITNKVILKNCILMNGFLVKAW